MQKKYFIWVYSSQKDKVKELYSMLKSKTLKFKDLSVSIPGGQTGFSGPIEAESKEMKLIEQYMVENPEFANTLDEKWKGRLEYFYNEKELKEADFLTFAANKFREIELKVLVEENGGFVVKGKDELVEKLSDKYFDFFFGNHDIENLKGFILNVEFPNDTDLLGNTLSGFRGVFVTKKVKNIIEENKFSGVKLYPVWSENKDAFDEPDYYVLSSFSPIDMTKFEIREESNIPVVRNLRLKKEVKDSLSDFNFLDYSNSNIPTTHYPSVVSREVLNSFKGENLKGIDIEKLGVVNFI